MRRHSRYDYPYADCLYAFVPHRQSRLPDTCLVDAFRAMGTKVPYERSGGFWALRDGSVMLKPFSLLGSGTIDLVTLVYHVPFLRWNSFPDTLTSGTRSFATPAQTSRCRAATSSATRHTSRDSCVCVCLGAIHLAHLAKVYEYAQ